ncbi:Hermansky-Pudlak syndrome 3 protein-like isoform X2 [Argonauta hians]
MVRVFRCFGFKSQVVLPVVDEPISLCTSSDRVFIATVAGSLEVFRIQVGKGWKNVCSVSTEGLVQQLAYSEKDDYLATLEVKPFRHENLTFIKTYLDLKKWENKTNFSISLRVAEKYPVIIPGQPVFEVLEIPQEEKANSLSVCSHTGTLAVACCKKVNIYMVQEKFSSECSRSYKDIVHILILNWGHVINKVVINESFVALMSNRYAHVLKLNFYNGFRKVGLQMSNPASQAKLEVSEPKATSSSFETTELIAGDFENSPPPPSSSSNELFLPSDSSSVVSIKNDEAYTQWVFSSDQRGSRKKRRSFGQGTRNIAEIANVAITPDTIYLPKLHGNCGINGSTKSLPKVVVQVKDQSVFVNGKIKADTLLYKIGLPDISWRHLQLLCIYSASGQGTPSQCDSDFPLQSIKCDPKMEMFCYLGNSHEGQLYSLSPPAVQMLSSYKYSSPALQAVTSPTMLFVVTDTGIETYTSRGAAFSLYRRNHYDNIYKAIPPVDLEPCLCGIQPFFNASEISVISSPKGTMMDSHVILLSKVTELNDTMWSLYALEPYSAMDTYKDLIVFSTKYQDSVQEAYLHVLQEANLILRGPVVDSEIEYLEEYQNLFAESCQKLGDFYAWHPCSDWKLCLPYYNMSGISLKDALQKASDLSEKDQAISFKHGKGFLYYLKRKIFGCSEPLNLTPDESSLILSVFSKCSAQDVSSIILLSRLNNYSPEKALALMGDIKKRDLKFSKKSKLSYLNNLACVVLYLNLCDLDAAELELSNIPKTDLVQICVEHSQLIYEDLNNLTPLAQLLRKSCADVLLEILVCFHDQRKLSYTACLQLLQGDYEIHRNTHIKMFLELLIKDKKRMDIFPEISYQLVNIYLQRLVEWKPPLKQSITGIPSNQSLLQEAGHFASRYPWLDLLPPFQGIKSYRTACHYFRSPSVTTPIQPFMCPCYFCNEDLLKLQSLLCSLCAKEILFQTVEIAIQSGGTTDSNQQQQQQQHLKLPWHISLDLLCKASIDVCDAIDTILLDHPQILPDFCASMLDSHPKQWKYLMEKFQTLISEDNTEHNPYNSIFQDMLSEMVKKLKTPDVLHLVPANGSLSYFLPYLNQCCIKDQLVLLEKTIVEKGQSLTLYD